MLDVPDTAENAAEFGYSGKVDVNRSAFPQVRIATLSEVGTHATNGGPLGEDPHDERTLAQEVIDGYLQAGMLMVADRGCYSYDLWTSHPHRRGPVSPGL